MKKIILIFKKQLWRLPLFAGILMTIIYLIIFWVTEKIPHTEEIILFSASKFVLFPADKLILTLPFQISGAWNILLVPLWVFSFLIIWKGEIKFKERIKLVRIKSEDKRFVHLATIIAHVFFIVIFGAFFGIVPGMMIGGIVTIISIIILGAYLSDETLDYKEAFKNNFSIFNVALYGIFLSMGILSNLLTIIPMCISIIIFYGVHRILVFIYPSTIQFLYFISGKKLNTKFIY
jgi:hypothetical protein